MSNQEMQFADPDWKPSQPLEEEANSQERKASVPQPINADPREQSQWRTAPPSPPQQGVYAGLPPYAGTAPQQMQGGDYRQPQYRRRGRSPWFWIILAIIIISLMSGSFGSFNSSRFGFGRGPIEQSYHYTVSGQPTLVINDASGKIRIVAGSSNSDVTIQAIKQSNFFGNPKDMQVTPSQVGNTITANVQGSGPDSVSFEVTVPQGTNVQLRTDSGDVDIEGVNGQMTLTTNSGDIVASNDTVNGRSTITTNSGDITARQTALSDQATMGTNSGDIDFDGTIGTSGTYQFQTDSGSVNLTLAPTSAFHIDASTNSGSIGDFPGVVVQKNDQGSGAKASGDVGGSSQGPSAKVTITTGSGDINLHQR
jgi:Putative adhesin